MMVELHRTQMWGTEGCRRCLAYLMYSRHWIAVLRLNGFRKSVLGAWAAVKWSFSTIKGAVVGA